MFNNLTRHFRHLPFERNDLIEGFFDGLLQGARASLEDLALHLVGFIQELFGAGQLLATQGPEPAAAKLVSLLKGPVLQRRKPYAAPERPSEEWYARAHLVGHRVGYYVTDKVVLFAAARGLTALPWAQRMHKHSRRVVTVLDKVAKFSAGG